MNRIAYLAPEIPALSATFVYNEILALQDKGFEIIPISVHIPQSVVLESRVEALQETTRYLYQRELSDFIAAALLQCCAAPLNFCRVVRIVLRDAITIGAMTRSGMGLFYRFLAACRVACILDQEHCSHIHAHFAHVPTDITMYAAALARIPFSFTAHANDLFERRWLLSEKIARSKFVATISEFNKNFMLRFGGEREKIHIVRCGIDSTRFVPLPQQPAIPPYTIGSIGRMVAKKGFDTLLQAAALLKNGGIDFRLAIAGSGPLELELRTRVQRLGIDGLVDFPGPVVHDQVPDWLHSLDLFVLPCRQDVNGDMDGIPVVLMEAMAAGVPVISTCISGIPELITHEYEGLLTPPQSPEALADAITRLMFEHELRTSCAAHGRQKVTKEFDEELNCNRLVSLLYG